MIMNKDNVGFVKGVHHFGKVTNVAKKKDKEWCFLLGQLTKGNETILASLVVLKPDVTVEMPDYVAELLK